MKENQAIKAMGTTLTGAYIDEEMITTFNLGDSRTYILKNNMLSQLTKDDSEVQILIDMGIITEGERNFQDNKNIITKFFDTEQERYFPVVVEQKVKFQKGDILLLCSDGLTDFLQVEELEEEINLQELSLMEKAKRLVNKTIKKGSYDNISVVLVQKL